MVEVIAGREFVGALASAVGIDALLDRDPPFVAVDLAGMERSDANTIRDGAERLQALPVVVVGLAPAAPPTGPAAALTDVVAAPDDPALARIEATMTTNPRAATALALLLRGGAGRSVAAGLAAESAVYSMLQAGPEFEAWRAGRPPRDARRDIGATVRVARDGDCLHVTLTRPDVRNALDTRMRDELYEAFTIAASDPSVRVLLDGDGPSFCAGGDLDEFGSRSDPASAHVIRLRRSVGRLIAGVADRVEAVVHGACMGSGVELPAFAGRVVARPDARFGLPEVGLGLIPGAGGTVSVTARVGRHRTAYLALTGNSIDAHTARAWGLVDAIADAP